MRDDSSWRERAACRDIPTEVFFPASAASEAAVAVGFHPVEIWPAFYRVEVDE
jgi:hypothetical protein